jgi:hypothetical protein
MGLRVIPSLLGCPHARPFVGVFKVNFEETLSILAINAHKMAPKTT